MQAAGELPEKLDFSAITAEPPRDPAHGDIATNAAMVLAKAAGKKPRDIAEPLLARLKANPDVVDGAVAGPGFINLKIADSFWRERLRECLTEGIAYGDSQVGAGRRSTSNTSRPIRPVRCTWRTPAARWWAMRSPTFWRRRATPSPRNTTSTTPAPRSTSSASRPTCAIARRWAITSSGFPKASIPASISRRSAPRSPSATARAGSTSPRPTGCPRCAPSPSPR